MKDLRDLKITDICINVTKETVIEVIDLLIKLGAVNNWGHGVDSITNNYLYVVNNKNEGYQNSIIVSGRGALWEFKEITIEELREMVKIKEGAPTEVYTATEIELMDAKKEIHESNLDKRLLRESLRSLDDELRSAKRTIFELESFHKNLRDSEQLMRDELNEGKEILKELLFHCTTENGVDTEAFEKAIKKAKHFIKWKRQQ